MSLQDEIRDMLVDNCPCSCPKTEKHNNSTGIKTCIFISHQFAYACAIRCIFYAVVAVNSSKTIAFMIAAFFVR